MSWRDAGNFSMFEVGRQAKVGKKLVEASAAIDVHELAAETDAKRRHSSLLDLGHERQFESLPGRIDRFGFGVIGLAIKRRIEIVSAAEEHAVDQIDDFGNQRQVCAIGQEQWKPPGLFHRGGIGHGGFVVVGLIVRVNGNADNWAWHGARIGGRRAKVKAPLASSVGFHADFLPDRSINLADALMIEQRWKTALGDKDRDAIANDQSLWMVNLEPIAADQFDGERPERMSPLKRSKGTVEMIFGHGGYYIISVAIERRQWLATHYAKAPPPAFRRATGLSWHRVEPRKYLSSSWWNTDPAGDTCTNKVAQDRNFISSGEPKISSAVRSSTLMAALAYFTSRGPRMGCPR